MIFKAGLIYVASLGLIWTCIYLKQWKTIYHDANFSFSRFQTSNLYRVANIIKPYSTNQNIKNNAAGWICVTIFESSWLKYRSVGHGGVEGAKPPQILKDHLTLSLPGRGRGKIMPTTLPRIFRPSYGPVLNKIDAFSHQFRAKLKVISILTHHIAKT